MYLHIIIISILLFLIYSFNKKKLESYDIVKKYFLNSNEQIEILNRLVENGIKYDRINNIHFIKSNNTDIIDISGSGSVNIKNYFNISDVDIRQYLIGCTLFKMDISNFLSYRENNGQKEDFNIGLYNLDDYLYPGLLYNVIIVYPGFGVYCSQYYTTDSNTQYINNSHNSYNNQIIQIKIIIIVIQI
jgi:hypothetical protein